MSRPTCVLCFYLIGGLVAISFIVPDLMAQNYPDSQVWEKLKITIYLVSFTSNKKITKIYSRDHSTSRSSSRGSSLYVHCKPIPVMKTGFSLWTFSHREKPVFITGIPAMRTGFPVMKTGFSQWEKVHRENPVFITGMGLQCNELKIESTVSGKLACCTMPAGQVCWSFHKEVSSRTVPWNTVYVINTIFEF